MFSILKFSIAFCFSFLLLSIPVQEKPLFYYLNTWAQPITEEVFSGSREALLDGVKKGKSFSTKIFNNTIPKEDKISTKSSSVDKEELEEHLHNHSEDYTMEERDMLQKIILNNQ
ncbi:MAG: hypothetical protein VXV96_01630 [Bdellovibrionota bacterium]|jgi:hypothetical protein|nr:hypothetical protein [Bdellovibrionota bacterium]